MKVFTDFFSLRPIWTRRGLELVWWAHVASAVLQVGWMFQFMAWPGAVVGVSTIGMTIDRSLSTLLYLAIVRVVLELALRYLVADPASRGNRRAHAEVPERQPAETR